MRYISISKHESSRGRVYVLVMALLGLLDSLVSLLSLGFLVSEFRIAFFVNEKVDEWLRKGTNNE